MARNIFKRVKDALGGVSNIIGVAISCVSGIASIVVVILGHKDPDVMTVSVVYLLSFVGILAYLFLNLGGLANLFTEQYRLVVHSERAKRNYDRAVQFNEDADEAFTELSRRRGDFDAAIMKYLLAKPETPAEKANSGDQLRLAYQKFLNQICDAAVNAVSARKFVPATKFHANIKLFFAHEDGAHHRYRTSARSTNTKRNRFETDDRLNQSYVVEFNGIMEILLRKNNTKRYLALDDIEKNIHQWAEQSGDAIQEPTNGACVFYKNCLCVLITGLNYRDELNLTENDFVPLMVKECAIGVICIDSFSETFHGKAEESIMTELAQNVYAATRSYEFAKYISSTLPELSKVLE